MRQRDAGAAIAAAISFCSLVTLHGNPRPADVPFDLVEQHLIVARGSVAGLRGLNLAAGVRKLEFPPARREVQSCQRTHCPRRIRLVADEVVGDHQDRGDR